MRIIPYHLLIDLMYRKYEVLSFIGSDSHEDRLYSIDIIIIDWNKINYSYFLTHLPPCMHENLNIILSW